MNTILREVNKLREINLWCVIMNLILGKSRFKSNSEAQITRIGWEFRFPIITS